MALTPQATLQGVAKTKQKFIDQLEKEIDNQLRNETFEVLHGYTTTVDSNGNITNNIEKRIEIGIDIDQLRGDIMEDLRSRFIAAGWSNFTQERDKFVLSFPDEVVLKEATV